MKNISKKNKLIYAIVFLIIIAGIIVYFTKGFNFEMKYAKRDQIILANKTGFDSNKIYEISKEVFSNKNFEIREVNIFNNAVAISAPEIIEEEKGEIIEKINNEYGLEISTENIKIQNIEHIRINDIIKPYILPMVITFALSLLYFLIRYRKLGVKKILTKGIVLPIASELVFFGIIAITRIPFGDIITALALVIYVIILVILTSCFEKEYETIKENDNNKTSI